MTKAETKKIKVAKKSQVIFDSKKTDKSGGHVHKKSDRIRGRLKKFIRKPSQHPVAKAMTRFGASAGVILIILFTLISLFLPKNGFQKAKERLAKNPHDFEAHLVLAEKLLENNQFEEAERVLLLAQKTEELKNQKTKEQKRKVKLEKLWERKHNSDPEDIRQLINAWEKILEEKPDYRDGHLQLAILHYQIFEDQKAKDYLEKTLELDPNHEPARKLEKILGN